MQTSCETKKDYLAIDDYKQIDKKRPSDDYKQIDKKRPSQSQFVIRLRLLQTAILILITLLFVSCMESSDSDSKSDDSSDPWSVDHNLSVSVTGVIATVKWGLDPNADMYNFFSSRVKVDQEEKLDIEYKFLLEKRKSNNWERAEITPTDTSTSKKTQRLTRTLLREIPIHILTGLSPGEYRVKVQATITPPEKYKKYSAYFKYYSEESKWSEFEIEPLSPKILSVSTNDESVSIEGKRIKSVKTYRLNFYEKENGTEVKSCEVEFADDGNSLKSTSPYNCCQPIQEVRKYTAYSSESLYRLECKVENLGGNTYEVKARAKIGGEFGKDSNKEFEIFAAPKNFKVEVTDPNTYPKSAAKFTWDKIEGVTEYELSWQKGTGQKWIETVQVESFTLRHSPKGKYKAQVRAKKAESYGIPSEKEKFKLEGREPQFNGSRWSCWPKCTVNRSSLGNGHWYSIWWHDIDVDIRDIRDIGVVIDAAAAAAADGKKRYRIEYNNGTERKVVYTKEARYNFGYLKYGCTRIYIRRETDEFFGPQMKASISIPRGGGC